LEGSDEFPPFAGIVIEEMLHVLAPGTPMRRQFHDFVLTRHCCHRYRPCLGDGRVAWRSVRPIAMLLPPGKPLGSPRTQANGMPATPTARPVWPRSPIRQRSGTAGVSHRSAGRAPPRCQPSQNEKGAKHPRRLVDSVAAYLQAQACSREAEECALRAARGEGPQGSALEARHGTQGGLKEALRR